MRPLASCSERACCGAGAGGTAMSKRPKLSHEMQELLRQANIVPEKAETQLRQRAVFQMREYLRVLNYRLHRGSEVADAASESRQIEHLLQAIHQTARPSAC